VAHPVGVAVEDDQVAVVGAWVSGGYRWPLNGPKWVQFCDWPGNLLAVSSSANMSDLPPTAPARAEAAAPVLAGQ
jgi:hypothetical protein